MATKTGKEGLLPLFLTFVAIAVTLNVARSVFMKLFSKIYLVLLQRKETSNPPAGEVTGLFIHPGTSLLLIVLVLSSLNLVFKFFMTYVLIARSY